MITMENKQRVKTIAVIFIIAIVLISLMTEFLYTFNNKYTYNKLQPEKGSYCRFRKRKLTAIRFTFL